MWAWLEEVSADQLAARPEGADVERPLWQYVLHLIMHGFQRRADAATLLSEYGHSPVSSSPQLPGVASGMLSKNTMGGPDSTYPVRADSMLAFGFL
jgi:hypothetical protein